DIVRAARRLAFDLDRYAYSTYVVELIDSMVEGREAEPAMFDLTEAMLQRVDSSAEAPAPEWLRHFDVRLLTLTGPAPRLGRGQRCCAKAGGCRGRPPGWLRCGGPARVVLSPALREQTEIIMARQSAKRPFRKKAASSSNPRTKSKHVYFFGGGKAEGTAKMKD